MKKDILSKIDFSKDYYVILEIQKDDLIEGEDINTRRQNSKFLHEIYRTKAFKYHPDMAKDADEKKKYVNLFKDIVKAYTILSDPYMKKVYEKFHGNEELLPINDQDSFDIDWEQIGKFKKDSIENEIGSAIFMKINEILVIPHNTGHMPSDEKYHNYVWDIEIKNFKKKLSISLIPDEDQVLSLTTKDKAISSLPFKIYIYFPQVQFVIDREDDEVIIDKKGKEIIYPGRIIGMKYFDHELYAGTNYDEVFDFIHSGKLEEEIYAYMSKFSK